VIAGKLKPALDKSFPLEEAAAAQEYLWHGKNFGKVTLAIG
jgi:NADPH:quinone reductase-like Zn-dependent oxidoreductase